MLERVAEQIQACIIEVYCIRALVEIKSGEATVDDILLQ